MAKAKPKRKKETGTVRKAAAKDTVESLTPALFVRKFLDEMNRVADELGVGPGLLSTLERSLPGGGWEPQVEMFERNGEFILRADLPGLGKDDVKVELADGAVTIEGERRDEREEKQKGFYSSERSYGKFYRRVSLPEGMNPENAEASFHDGVLEVTMAAPKHEPRAARKLEVRGKSEAKTKAKAA